MALWGSLEDMAVADLIQHNCLDNKTSRLVVEKDDQQATLFFKEGAVTDASLGNLKGEEAVYKLLTWQDGTFTLEAGHEAPTVTISQSWSGLLLEGARLLDESRHIAEKNGTTPELDIQSVFEPPEKKKSERFAEILDELVTEETDLEGAAVIGLDGLIYAARMPRSLNEKNSAGPVWAAVLGLSQRSVKQLNRGAFKQTLIQSDRDNIIISDLNDNFVFVGLIPSDVNLGIVLSEARTVIEKLQQTL